MAATISIIILLIVASIEEIYEPRFDFSLANHVFVWVNSDSGRICIQLL